MLGIRLEHRLRNHRDLEERLLSGGQKRVLHPLSLLHMRIDRRRERFFVLQRVLRAVPRVLPGRIREAEGRDEPAQLGVSDVQVLRGVQAAGQAVELPEVRELLPLGLLQGPELSKEALETESNMALLRLLQVRQVQRERDALRQEDVCQTSRL